MFDFMVKKQNEIKEIFEILEKDYRTDIDTELKYENNYQLLVAIMLSAQATDKGVNRATTKLFSLLKTPQDALKLGFDKINELIKTINYHNVKAKHIIELSKMLIDKFNSVVPNNFEDLTSLAGIGRKTANLVLSIAFKQNKIAVDTHCFRVANRIGITRAKNVLESEMQLTKNVPENKHRLINQLLVQFGRDICNAKNPKCDKCKLRKYCKYYKNLLIK